MNNFLVWQSLRESTRHCITSANSSQKCPADFIEVSSNFQDFFEKYESQNLSIDVHSMPTDVLTINFTSIPVNINFLEISGFVPETKVFLSNKLSEKTYLLCIKFTNCSIETDFQEFVLNSINLRSSFFTNSKSFPVTVITQEGEMDLCAVENINIGTVTFFDIRFECYKPTNVVFLNQNISEITVFGQQENLSLVYSGHYAIIEDVSHKHKLSIESHKQCNLKILFNDEKSTSLTLSHSFISQVVANIKTFIEGYVPMDIKFAMSVWKDCAVKKIKIYQSCFTNYYFDSYYIPAFINIRPDTKAVFHVAYKDTLIERVETHSDIEIFTPSMISFLGFSVFGKTRIKSSSSIKAEYIQANNNSDIDFDVPTIYIVYNLYIVSAKCNMRNLVMMNNSFISYNIEDYVGKIECESFTFKGIESRDNAFNVVRELGSNSTIDSFPIVTTKNKFTQKFAFEGKNNCSLVGSYKYCNSFAITDNEILLDSVSTETYVIPNNICIVENKETATDCLKNYEIFEKKDIPLLGTRQLPKSLIIQLTIDLDESCAISFSRNISARFFVQKNIIYDLFLANTTFKQLEIEKVSLHFLEDNVELICGSMTFCNSYVHNVSLLRSDIISVYDKTLDEIPNYLTNQIILISDEGVEKVVANDTAISLDSSRLHYNIDTTKQKHGVNVLQKTTQTVEYFAYSDTLSLVSLQWRDQVFYRKLLYYGDFSVTSFINLSSFYTVEFHTLSVPKDVELYHTTVFCINESTSLDLTRMSFHSKTNLKTRNSSSLDLHLKELNLQGTSSIKTTGVSITTDSLILNSSSLTTSSPVVVKKNIFIGHDSQTGAECIHPGNSKVVEVNITYSMGNVPYAYLGNLTDGKVLINMNNDGNSLQLFIDDGWEDYYFDVLCFDHLNFSNVETHWYSESWKFNGDDRFFDLVKRGNCLSISRREKEITPQPDNEEEKNPKVYIIASIVCAGFAVIVCVFFIVRYFINKRKVSTFMSDTAEVSMSLSREIV